MVRPFKFQFTTQIIIRRYTVDFEARVLGNPAGSLHALLQFIITIILYTPCRTAA